MFELCGHWGATEGSERRERESEEGEFGSQSGRAMEAGRPVRRWRRDLGRGDKGIRTGRCLRWRGKNEGGHAGNTEHKWLWSQGERRERRVPWGLQTPGLGRAAPTREEEVRAELGQVWCGVPSLVQPTPPHTYAWTGHRPLVSSSASKTSWGRLKITAGYAFKKL